MVELLPDVSNRHLRWAFVPPLAFLRRFAGDTRGSRLSSGVEELAVTVLGSIELLPTALRHRVWDYEPSLRSALGHGNIGFTKRSTPTSSVARVEPVAAGVSRIARSSPASDKAGLLGGVPESALGRAAAHFGIELELAEPSSARQALLRATGERWPLVAITARCAPWIDPIAMVGYLRSGGTIVLPELLPSDNVWLQRLADQIHTDIPLCRPLPSPATHITFCGRRPDFGAEMAGMRIQNREGVSYLESTVRSGALVTLLDGADSRAAVVEVCAYGGRLVPAAAPPPPVGNLCDVFQPDHALSMLPAMLLVRQLYGQAAWHQPFAMANFTVDDPVLRKGFLGLDYAGALAAARQDDFHLTVATVPRELACADSAVVRLLAENHDRITACYHGNDHDGYEFFSSENSSSRFRNRPLAVQREAACQAASRGERFAGRTGHALDRVMVFPHGVGPGALLGDMRRLGFLASSNWLDRYPLAFPRPADADLGMRPADVAWAGFPLLWRRPFEDQTFAFDLVAGRPVLYFTHRKEVGADFGALRGMARRINDAAPGKLRWKGLEEIARHAYIQRRRSGSVWEVWMTASVACLHNPGPDPRLFVVHRPHLPTGAWLVATEFAGHGSQIELTVAPGGTAVVRMDEHGAQELPDPLAGRPCSLTAEPDS